MTEHSKLYFTNHHFVIKQNDGLTIYSNQTPSKPPKRLQTHYLPNRSDQKIQPKHHQNHQPDRTKYLNYVDGGGMGFWRWWWLRLIMVVAVAVAVAGWLCVLFVWVWEKNERELDVCDCIFLRDIYMFFFVCERGCVWKIDVSVFFLLKEVMTETVMTEVI